jgi:hypothetical protein
MAALVPGFIRYCQGITSRVADASGRQPTGFKCDDNLMEDFRSKGSIDVAFAHDVAPFGSLPNA